MALDPDLAKVRAGLLRGLRVDVGPDQGQDAFERHQLLAIRFHRAAKLNAPDQGDRAGWRQYFSEHFPRGDDHALRLWEYWRCALIKNECPGACVAVSHGQPHGHWKMVDSGERLYINLESMWDDFEQSVESFIEMLGSDPQRRAATLEYWAKHQYSVQIVTLPSPVVTASIASASATSLTLRPRG